VSFLTDTERDDVHLLFAKLLLSLTLAASSLLHAGAAAIPAPAQASFGANPFDVPVSHP